MLLVRTDRPAQQQPSFGDQFVTSSQVPPHLHIHNPAWSVSDIAMFQRFNNYTDRYDERSC